MDKEKKISVEEVLKRISVAVAKEKPVAPMFQEKKWIFEKYRFSRFWGEGLENDKSQFKTIVKREFSIGHFLKYDDDQFILASFVHLLGRDPSEIEIKHFLEYLKTNSKIAILHKILNSNEAKQRAVTIKEFKSHYIKDRIYNLKYIGKYIKVISLLKNISLIVDSNKQFEKFIIKKFDVINDKSRMMLSEIETNLNDLTLKTGMFLNDLKFNKANLDFVRKIKSDQTQISYEANQLRSDANQLRSDANHNKLKYDLFTEETNKCLENIETNIKSVKNYKSSIISHQKKLASLIDDAKKRLPEILDNNDIKEIVNEERNILDAAYNSFEQKFRGSRENIKNRLKVYSQYLKKLDHKSKVIDLGCGRGEWLELLQDNQIKPVGIDQNRLFIEECKKENLNVIESDIFEFLRKQKNNSQDCVTSFHLIEHLPNNLQIKLIDEILRILKHNGVMILETPNPENLLVGACFFYHDITHRNPLVPEALEFIIKERGFVKTKIMRLNKYSDFHEVSDLDPFKEKWFYSEMDFAVIAYKE